MKQPWLAVLAVVGAVAVVATGVAYLVTQGQLDDAQREATAL